MYRKRTIMALLIVALLFVFSFTTTFALISKKGQSVDYQALPNYFVVEEVRLVNFSSYWHFIRIRDTNISASGDAFSLQMKDSQNTIHEYNGFWGALATKFSYYYPNYSKPYNVSKLDTHDNRIYNIGVDDRFYEELLKENLTLIFLSDYNGTHFTQNIIFARGAVSYKTTFYDYESKQDISQKNGTELMYQEVNHTRIIATEPDSPYNPSKAIYNSTRYFSNYNYHDYILEYTFLIPTKYLPLELKEDNLYNFTWVICYQYYNESARYSRFFNETGNPTMISYELDTLYFVYVAMNGTILLIKSIPIVSIFAGTDNSSTIPSLILVFLGGLIATIIVGVYVLLKRQPYRKNKQS